MTRERIPLSASRSSRKISRDVHLWPSRLLVSHYCPRLPSTFPQGGCCEGFVLEFPADTSSIAIATSYFFFAVLTFFVQRVVFLAGQRFLAHVLAQHMGQDSAVGRGSARPEKLRLRCESRAARTRRGVRQGQGKYAHLFPRGLEVPRSPQLHDELQEREGPSQRGHPERGRLPPRRPREAEEPVLGLRPAARAARRGGQRRPRGQGRSRGGARIP